jgi:hypothetical protein
MFWLFFCVVPTELYISVAPFFPALTYRAIFCRRFATYLTIEQLNN